LKDELESNVESLISKVSAGNLQHRLEEISRSYNASYNATSFEAVGSGDEPGSGGTLEMESGGGPTTTLYLNAWFPKHPDRKRGLPVGFATDLAVNIGPVPYAQLFTGEGSDPIPVDQSHLFYSINSVDIMVMCPEARVEPICQSLNMPPGPDATVFFKIIPSKIGKFQLTVVILIHNDPIHRTSFSFDASATDQATESIRAEERVGS
jgi:hypothetical protein